MTRTPERPWVDGPGDGRTTSRAGSTRFGYGKVSFMVDPVGKVRPYKTTPGNAPDQPEPA
jgi:hypothetical protein